MAADSPLPEPTGAYTPDPETQSSAAPGAITEAPGSRIGHYKLLQKIGEGGMGTVYMAEQEQPVRRRVAVKIIKPGMDSAQVMARFEAERQALALMDHQHIARVLDAGTTPNGRPFFVMELVQGVPITEYCDKARLTPRERLELFVPDELPHAEAPAASSVQRLAASLLSAIQSAAVERLSAVDDYGRRALLEEFLAGLQREVPQLAEAISACYLSHLQPARH
jgi:hypothetical protein